MKIRGFEPVSRKGVEFIQPTRNDSGSAGYDFYYPYHESLEIYPNQQETIKSGIKAYMLPDEILEVNVRSSFGIYKNVILANVIGWIDSSYYNNPDNEGEIIVVLKNLGNCPITINYRDKYCQVKFTKYLTADDDIILNETRKGGIGSSGI